MGREPLLSPFGELGEAFGTLFEPVFERLGLIDLLRKER